jgi:hypothetical protein
MRGEAPYGSARVVEHVPDGRASFAAPKFDERYQVFAEEPSGIAQVGSSQAADLMLAVPTRFSWRAHESELLVWKHDGWNDASHPDRSDHRGARRFGHPGRGP